MARLIYAIKIFMYSAQLKLPKSEERGLGRFLLFGLAVYIPAWYTAQDVVQAPANDLNVIMKIIAFKDIDIGVFNAASSAFSNHLWYLSENLLDCLSMTYLFVQQKGGKWWKP